jgi:phosphotransferase system HPr-like phosphotransfer protein
MNVRTNLLCTIPRGLTMREAGRIVATVMESDSYVAMEAKGGRCFANNIPRLLSLSLACGDAVDVVADGPDAYDVVRAIGTLLGQSTDEADVNMSFAELCS